MNFQINTGIFFGISAAALQSLSYIFSRRFLLKCSREHNSLLFSLSHIHMGLLSLLLLPLMLHSFPGRSILLPLAGTAGFYLVAQWLLFLVLKTTEASQLTPLLGFKIPLLALYSFFFAGTLFNPAGWLAIVFCTAGGLIVSPPLGALNIKLLASALLIAAGYAGSDFLIPVLIKELNSFSHTPVAAAVCLCYNACGLAGFCLLATGLAGRRTALADKKAHLAAMPYSFTWLMAMVCLFACFNYSGVIFGNMLQATRAFLSVFLGLLVTRLGFLGIENLKSWKIFLRRLTGAVIISAAIILFYYQQ